MKCYEYKGLGRAGGLGDGFHAACLNKGPSVAIAITTGGYVFGGATDKPWGKPLGCTEVGHYFPG